MIGINNICIVYFIWASKVSELRPSEPRIILLAESGDLDNHNAARLDGLTYRMNQTTFVESIFDINTCRPT